jgi:dolichol-phosphate mannosyltransferase
VPNELGVIIPAYCEEENIARLCLSIIEIFPLASILVVDDSPNDQTSSQVVGLNESRVQVHQRDSKKGRGSAVLYGMRELNNHGFEFVLEMDADFSHNPGEIKPMIELARTEKVDLVIAGRYCEESQILNWPKSRRFFSKFSNKIARFLLRVPVNDYTNGFRLYSRDASNFVTENCGKTGDGFIALSEILVNLHYTGFKVQEIPSTFKNRIRGSSSLNYKEIVSAAIGLFKIYQIKRKLSCK